MNNNPATADQLLELATLQIKRIKEVADQEEVKTAIARNDHSFWAKFTEAVETLKAKTTESVKSVLKSLKTITVGATKTKPTTNCFTDTARYYYRDNDLDRYLPKNQSDQAESQFGVLPLTETTTFKEFAESVLGTQGDLKTLAKLLQQRGYTTTLPAIEALIERQESGEDTGLLTNGWANFFFVDNEDGESVSVVGVGRCGSRWYVIQRSFGGGCGGLAGRRFFLRNFLGTL